MKPISVLSNKVLHELASCHGMSYSFEELTKLVFPVSNVLKKITDNVSVDRENQTKLLHTLILLEYEGYIFLNTDTDESSITIKGLIKINNKFFCN